MIGVHVGFDYALDVEPLLPDILYDLASSFRARPIRNRIVVENGINDGRLASLSLRDYVRGIASNFVCELWLP